MAIRKAISGLSVYVDGVDYVGVSTEFTPPEITVETVESNMPGHLGVIQIPTGRLEHLEAKFSMGDAFPALDALVGHPAATDTTVLFVRVATDGSVARGVEWELTGLWSKQEAGEQRGGGSQDAGDCTYTISCRTFTHRIDGAEIRHIDIERAVHRIRGVDVHARLREQLRRVSATGTTASLVVNV